MVEEAPQENLNEENAQKCRAELRERFLWAMTSLVGKETTANMHENICVSGIYSGMDKDILSVQIQNLKTPSITYPWGQLRLPDCHSLEFKVQAKD